MKDKIISNQEVKGTKDWLPEEMNIRKYIFDKWRQVCLSYGFIEYLTPILENAEVYRAKSGEDIGGKELMVFVDQGGRELAIRPEMTPSVVRMVSKIYNTSPKPLKLFSIANFVRNEKPQRGRNREFWQLNCDIFGDDNLLSDLEALQMSLDLVLAFNPPKGSFALKINHRGLINYLFDSIKLDDSQKILVMRLMDKYNKMTGDELISKMEGLGLKNEQIDKVLKFITADSLDELIGNNSEMKETSAFSLLFKIIEKLKKLGYEEYVKFSPEVIRGFDYYDGLVFELFDNHKDNNRAMFGGGRYNGLANIFGGESFSAIGFAPGDETFKLFLESWDILPKIGIKDELYYLPILSDKLDEPVLSLANKLRKKGKRVEISFNTLKISKVFEYADKNKIGYVVVLGEDEFERGEYKIKNMKTGVEEIFKLK
ncbi:MAG TPA: histidine--tRNA ligase [bacterium]|nr:histidine--tRNA ligase [bacterium]